MATRLKTIEYWFNELDSVTDNTDTNFTQLTIDIPESSPSFKSVTLEVIIQDAEATANNVNRRQVSLQLASAGYSVVNNTNLLTASAEQKWIMHSGDFTSYFNTNWTGTSMTCDGRILCDSAIATPAQNWRNATGKLTITYSYDDTSATHIKTVWIPLFAPIAAMATSKPGTAVSTIPNLETFCPENSKTFKQISIVVQGNDEYASTTDRTISMQLDASGSTKTTTAHESALNTSCWYRHVWQGFTMTTNATHDFYIWCSTASFAHAQVWMVVTYTFTISGTTSVLNSLLIPMEFVSPMGGVTSSDYQRATKDLWIEEPGTITIQQSAIFYYWDQNQAVTGINTRINGGGWSGNLTSTASTVAGGCGSMMRMETYVTLSRGKNTIYTDLYKTLANVFGWNLTACMMINYTSGMASSGIGTHNHTVRWNLATINTSAAQNNYTISAVSVDLPEDVSDLPYFINSGGVHMEYISNSTSNPTSVVIQSERLSGEGGTAWDPIYQDIGGTDALVGVRQIFSQGVYLIKQYLNQPNSSNKYVIKNDRRYKIMVGNVNVSCNFWYHMDVLITYHAITFSVSGNVTGSGGGTVTLNLHRDSDGELLASTTRTGDGSYSLTWYDSTEDVYVQAYEDGTHIGRSDKGKGT